MPIRTILPLPPAAPRHLYGVHPKHWRGGAQPGSLTDLPGLIAQFGFFVLVVFINLPVIVLAQEYGASDNEVIKVAERMYCPVCENIPLDECQTTACLEWKDEIGAQLAAGRTPQQVIDSFVARFGDHVVGVPQDPLIRALTFILPVLAALLALAVGWHTFRRFGKAKQLSLEQEAAGADLSENSYRQRLENDIRALR